MTPSPQKSLVMFLEVFALLALGLVVKNNVTLNDYNKIKIEKAAFFGVTTAIILFFTEYFSEGVIFKSFRGIFQSSSPHIYQLNSLDRGCALLSISSWILIGVLLSNRRYIQSLCFYGLVFLILYLSDSLASLIAFSLAGLLLVFGRFISTKFFKLTTMIILIGSILFPITMHTLDPYKTSDEYSKILPDSAKHRLFIWNFITKKIKAKPITGAGFGSSKQYVVAENEMIDYKDYHWSPLPLHPHSNVLQILFEIGVIGLLLFLLLVFKYLRKVEAAILSNINFGSACYACFVNYYVIGMISFSVWQTWWVATGVWVVVMLSMIRQRTAQESCSN